MSSDRSPDGTTRTAPDPRDAQPTDLPGQEQELPGSEARMDPRPDFGEQSYVGHGRLEGRVALVTGGDSGIGRAVSLAFAREGADVAISYLPEEQEDAEETRRVVADAGRRALLEPGDVGDPEYCRSLVERCVDELGRLDTLVLNAGTQSSHDSILEIPDEVVEAVFRTNVMSMFWLAKAAIPHMQPGSTIITTSSIQAVDPSPQLMHYAATKGAIVNFTQGLARELAERGIRVNSVAPGPIWTPLIPASFEADHVDEFGQDTPLGRAGQPVEVAPAYVFLASDESRYVTGEVIAATGGKLFAS